MRGLLVVIAVIILGALGYFFFLRNEYEEPQQPAATTQTQSQSKEATLSNQQSKKETETSAETTITYTDSGFSPQRVTIKSGGSIKWVNNSSSNVKVGSDPHPIHTINQEVSGNQFVLELAPGESKSVQLTKQGEWGYHNHLKSSMAGKIVVE